MVYFWNIRITQALSFHSKIAILIITLKKRIGIFLAFFSEFSVTPTWTYIMEEEIERPICNYSETYMDAYMTRGTSRHLI